MELWSHGVMESWSYGVMELWSHGVEGDSHFKDDSPVSTRDGPWTYFAEFSVFSVFSVVTI